MCTWLQSSWYNRWCSWPLQLIEGIMRQGKQVPLETFSSGLNFCFADSSDDFYELDQVFFEKPPTTVWSWPCSSRGFAKLVSRQLIPDILEVSSLNPQKTASVFWGFLSFKYLCGMNVLLKRYTQKVICFRNKKTPWISSDIVIPFCHHKYQFRLCRVLKKADFLWKYEYFSEIFFFYRIK